MRHTIMEYKKCIVTMLCLLITYGTFADEWTDPSTNVVYTYSSDSDEAVSFPE